MMDIMKFGVFLLFISLRQLSALHEVYPQYYWEDYCNQTLWISCSAAGSLTFRNPPGVGRCTVRIAVNPVPGDLVPLRHPTERFALYFHIRKFQMTQYHSVLIYEQATSVLKKNLTGGIAPSEVGPLRSPSVAQLLSEYQFNPTITLEFLENTDNHLALEDGDFDLDFIVLNTISSTNTYYCSALHGYILKKYACEYDQSRVNCPKRYVATVDATNPVTDLLRSDYLNRLCRNYDPSRSTSTFTWDFVLSLCVVLIILGSFLLCCVRSLKRQHNLTPSAPLERSSTRDPDPRDPYELYTIPANTRKVMGAPPSYEDVMADIAGTTGVSQAPAIPI
ncbi:hypothetical protein RvY_13424 [Ramazzottius varieornatus]|uniref:CUB domain-containing protein n=1 Tax=Ramazzottius varieornatus TaxID=947166 RepID=A0A1D1VMS6_RAMVA|nr:hypothetical protein RvY_13424 [Ramazzottius varieornatus]